MKVVSGIVHDGSTESPASLWKTKSTLPAYGDHSGCDQTTGFSETLNDVIQK